MDAYTNCNLCPRQCGARRTDGKAGACGCDARLRVARSALHYWEEPPISGEAGSGAIFFSGCPLKCVFCQNHQISHEGTGVEVGTDRLAHMMLELEQQGALNINLVTPMHYAPHIIEATKRARAMGLSLPLVCNTSGYELDSLVKAFDGIIDIWLTDFKYASAAVARELSGAGDYPTVAKSALQEMLSSLRRHGGRHLDEDGTMLRGIVVRHLVLPAHVEDSCAVLDTVWNMCGNEVDLSIMNQYTPNESCRNAGGPLSHSLSDEEYEMVLCHADDLGFEHLWWQQGGTVSESFVPAFDATGVLEPANSQ